MTLRKSPMSCGLPSRSTVREAQPTPAHATAMRKGAWRTASSTAVCMAASSTTSVATKEARSPSVATSALPLASSRSAMTT